MPITKCLSVRNPWADLIVRGYKSIENRTWATSYVGRIAIHASSGEAWNDFFAWFHSEDGACAECAEKLQSDDYMQPEEDRYSAIVGSVQLLECVGTMPRCSPNWITKECMPGYCLPEVDFADDNSPVYWRFASPHFYKRPIPAGGKLNLWNLSPEQIEAVRKAELAF